MHLDVLQIAFGHLLTSRGTVGESFGQCTLTGPKPNGESNRLRTKMEQDDFYFFYKVPLSGHQFSFANAIEVFAISARHVASVDALRPVYASWILTIATGV